MLSMTNFFLFILRMIFGQSAGSASVSLHTVLPASWPYFNKAGMNSGGFSLWAAASWPDKVAEYPDYSLPNMTARMQQLSGCDAGFEACIVNGSTSDILNLGSLNGLAYLPDEFGAVRPLPRPLGELGIKNQFKDAPVFGPTIDCVELLANPLDELKRGTYFGGPVIIGSNADESAYKGPDRRMTEEEYIGPGGWIETYVTPQFAGQNYNNLAQPNMQSVLPQHYAWNSTNVDGTMRYHTITVGTRNYSQSYQAAFHAQSDCRYSCAAQRAAQLIASMGHTVYLHLFNAPSSETHPFATHGSDIKYLFLKIAAEQGAAEVQLACTMAVLWTSFAATGEPSASDADEFTLRDEISVWPPYTLHNPVYAKLNGFEDDEPILSVEHASGYSQGQCQFWENLVPPTAYCE
eukprot:SAG31_NODE_5196_length_2683_cov_2.098297_2_plen_406_part_00